MKTNLCRAQGHQQFLSTLKVSTQIIQSVNQYAFNATVTITYGYNKLENTNAKIQYLKIKNNTYTCTYRPT